MIIDFHTHAFPDRIYERTIEILESNVVKYSKKIHKAAGSGNIDGLKTDMDKHGIDISVVLPIATSPKQTESIIAFADSVNACNDKIISFASLHPMNESPEDIVKKIAEMGFSGIKLHPDYQDFYIDSPESIRILKECEKCGLTVILHPGHDHGCAPPRHCTPKRLSNLLGVLSCNNIVCAHMGGWEMWDEAMEFVIGKPFMIDTSFSLHLLDSKMAVEIIRRHGADKVLFGTDWPWFSPADTINAVKSLGLTKEEEELIFYKNAFRLLGFSKI